jgi:adenylate cyclase
MIQTANQLNATVLFVAVREYPRIVNILDLQETNTFLNDCVDIITRAAGSNRGSLVNISGDRFYCVFGDPAVEFDNPRHGVLSALAIQNTSDEISVKWRHALRSLVELDVGISTGPVMIGGIGPAPQNEYTLVGRTVTLAEELGLLCKKCNVNVLVDTATYDKTKNYFSFRKAGDRSLFGFTEPIGLYTPVLRST